jgi:polyhydroxyalkanoate synthesis regulator protein
MNERSHLREPVLIKRYAGRRLYNTATLTYASLDDLREMALDRVRFMVRESESGEDIARAIMGEL